MGSAAALTDPFPSGASGQVWTEFYTHLRQFPLLNLPVANFLFSLLFSFQFVKPNHFILKIVFVVYHNFWNLFSVLLFIWNHLKWLLGSVQIIAYISISIINIIIKLPSLPRPLWSLLKPGPWAPHLNTKVERKPGQTPVLSPWCLGITFDCGMKNWAWKGYTADSLLVKYARMVKSGSGVWIQWRQTSRAGTPQSRRVVDPSGRQNSSVHRDRWWS